MPSRCEHRPCMLWDMTNIAQPCVKPCCAAQIAILQHKLLTCVMCAVASVRRLYQQCRWAPSTPNSTSQKSCPRCLAELQIHATTAQGRQRVSDGRWLLAGYVADLMSPLFPGAFLFLACIGSLSRAITGACRSHQEYPVVSDDIHELTVPQSSVPG